MTNYRSTLGLSDSAGAEEIKTAFRKLAMKHHPDRGGDTAMFQTINEAYMELENTGFAPYAPPRRASAPQNAPGGWQDRPAPRRSAPPQNPPGSWQDRPQPPLRETIDDIFEQMKSANRRPRYPGANPMYAHAGNEIVANVSIRDALAGFNVQVNRQRGNGLVEHVYVNVPAGTPNGHRGTYTLSDQTHQGIITRIEDPKFRVRGLDAANDLFGAGIYPGDIETEIEVDAMDLITGAWVKVTDFLGVELTVRVPAGFNPLHRLKVAGKGYVGWSQEDQAPTTYRRDMYIRLQPVFNKLNDLDPAKLKEVQDEIERMKHAS